MVTYSFGQGPGVAIFSAPNALSLSLAKKLLENSCRVILVSTEGEKWSGSTLQFLAGNSFEVSKQGVLRENIDYVVAICLGEGSKGQLSKIFDEVLKEANLALRVARDNSSKILFIFPYVQSNIYQRKFTALAKEILKTSMEMAAVVYVGQPVGKGMVFSEADLVSRMIGDFMTRGEVRIPKDNPVIYPVNVEVISGELMKHLFSFGFFGSEMALVPKGMPARKLYQLLKTLKESLGVVYEKRSWNISTPSLTRRIILDANLEEAVRNVLDYYPDKKAEEAGVKTEPTVGEKAVSLKKEPVSGRVKHPKSKIAGVWIAITGALVLILTPIVLTVFTLAALLLGGRELVKGDLSLAKSIFSFSKASASILDTKLQFVSHLPGLGEVSAPALSFSGILVKATEVADHTVLAAQYTTDLIDKVLGDEPYDPGLYSEKISLELDLVYRNVGFLESELANTNGVPRELLKGLVDNDNLARAREILILGRVVADELPDILGQKRPQRYLVLFQNNMELRPTGGFIGSFAIITFDKGRLSDMSVSDVYSADGQLKGHVEPPLPVKDYLGEANWFLRDSNWDPDFPTSANRAEWFLDKEIDTKVDGVLGIDLELARRVVESIGPITLADFSVVVDHNNLYEVTQREVEKDFFPGSHRKRNLLTALARELLVKISQLTNEQYPDVAKAVLDSLEEKHVQIFLHNIKVQGAISAVGWDGSVLPLGCTDNCIADWFGIVEANVGVNKANRYLQRAAFLTTVFEEGLIKRHLRIAYGNVADPSQGEEGRYKVYVRVMAVQNAEFGPVEVSGGEEVAILEPEIEELRRRKEAGVLVEVPAGQSRLLEFYWESDSDVDFDRDGEYRFTCRKQAGTLNDELVAEFVFPGGISLMASSPFTLTREKSVGYNTTLARDFSSRIFW
jgi:hypothetical protein